MNWFESIWLWFVENKDAIFAWVTSANVVGFATALVTLVRQHKAIKQNTSSNTELNKAVAEVKELKGEITLIKSEVVGIKDEVAKTETKLIENLDALDEYNHKLDTVIEVQQIAYSTVKDTTVRESINNVILNSKYKEQGTRAELMHEIDNLKSAAKEVTDKYNALVEESAKKVAKVADVIKEEPKVSTKSKVSRY